MRFGLLSIWKQIFRSPTREVLGENVKKAPLYNQRVNRKPMGFFGISILFDVILCESQNSASVNLSRTICHMLLFLKKEKYIKEMCT